ncbi:MAG: M28 family peptidase [Pseudomonadales bacterium]|jgi:hypothetical protein|nr:M28 family peptidase [Pseudomonadales bacterium]
MHDEHIPSGDRIFDWIRTVFDFGVRRPGYTADRQAEDLIEREFLKLGLDSVRREPVELPLWEPLAHSLSVTASGRTFEIPCFPLPHAAPTEPVDLNLRVFEPDDPGSMQGAAALHTMPLIEVPTTLPIDGGDMAAKPDAAVPFDLSLSGIAVDPRNSFAGEVQTLPFPAPLQSVMEPAMDAGAAAFIGALTNYPGDSYEYYVPYDGIERPIPGVWIRGSDGLRLRDLAMSGEVTVRLSVASRRETVLTNNIIGELPGADEELLVIGSHHDGPWASAVEDGSGIAMVLAQAAYWSQLPPSDRPHRLLFLLNSGHMAGGAGCHTFIEDNAALLKRIVLEVHLEHAALQFEESDGALAATGEPEPRWFFTSRNHHLRKALVQALEAEAVDRALIIAPDAFGEQPTTDGGAFYPVGVPLVNFLTAPFYLFDSMDTLDKIDRNGLVPLTRAIVRLIESTRGISPDAMRSGIAAYTAT